MYKKIVKITPLFFVLSSLSLFADIDLQKEMYEPAHEMMAMDEQMNRAIAQHRESNRILDESTGELQVTSMDDFEERENSYVLEKNIEDFNNTKVDVKLENRELTISTETTIIKKTKFSESKTMKSSSSSLSIPEDADENSMQKSYKNGVLKITFSKRKLFKNHH
ncbi:hypothetical protein MNB_SV-14-1752 [hydrothermal vent metagenome]|uniref:SHSP domain-containing protein n=1 Tax=hydrothermal vent metagenome TaxID=652676 RepID=A0A1W1BSC8_9ZZZZ